MNFYVWSIFWNGSYHEKNCSSQPFEIGYIRIKDAPTCIHFYLCMVPLINLHVKIQVSAIVRGLRLFDNALTVPFPQKAKGASLKWCNYWGFGKIIYNMTCDMFKIWHACQLDQSIIFEIYIQAWVVYENETVLVTHGVWITYDFDFPEAGSPSILPAGSIEKWNRNQSGNE